MGAGSPAWRRRRLYDGRSGSCGRCSAQRARRCAIFCASAASAGSTIRPMSTQTTSGRACARRRRSRRTPGARSQDRCCGSASGASRSAKLPPQLIRTHARLAAPGLVALDPAFADATDRDAAVYALRILLAAIGGTEHLPDAARAARAVRAHRCRTSFRATLSRAVIDARRARSSLRREGRGLPGAVGPRPAISGTGASGSAPAGRCDDRAARNRGMPQRSWHASHPLSRPTSRRSLVQVGAGGRAGAVARRPLPGSGGRRPAWRGESSRPGRASCRRSILRRPARRRNLLGADIPPEPPFAGHKERKA